MTKWKELIPQGNIKTIHKNKDIIKRYEMWLGGSPLCEAEYIAGTIHKYQ